VRDSIDWNLTIEARHDADEEGQDDEVHVHAPMKRVVSREGQVHLPELILDKTTCLLAGKYLGKCLSLLPSLAITNLYLIYPGYLASDMMDLFCTIGPCIRNMWIEYDDYFSYLSPSTRLYPLLPTSVMSLNLIAVPEKAKIFSLSPNLQELYLLSWDNLQDIFNWLPCILLQTALHTLECFTIRGCVGWDKQLDHVPETLDELLSQPQFKHLETFEIIIVGDSMLEEPTRTTIEQGMPRLLRRNIPFIRYIKDDDW
jgi:hypothetical protein